MTINYPQQIISKAELLVALLITTVFLGTVNTISLPAQQPTTNPKVKVLVQKALQSEDKNPTQAVQWLSEAIALAPNDATLYVYRARIVGFKFGNIQAAIQDATSCIERAPKFAYAYFLRGSCYLNVQRLVEADADFTRAIVLDPANVTAYANAGMARRLMGKLPEALAITARGLKLDPKNAALWYEQADVKRIMKAYKEAAQDYTNVLTYDPTNFNAYYNRAVCRNYTGDIAGAVADYNYLINVRPDKGLYFNRALMLHEANKPQEALADLQSALKLEPTFYRAQAFSAIIQLEQKQYQNALATCTTLLRANPNDMGGFANSGNAVTALLQKGEFINGEVYGLRAKARIALQDTTGACRDVAKASVLGQAEEMRQLGGICRSRGMFAPAADFPETLQFYARGANDSATVVLNGMLRGGGFDSAYAELRKNGILQERVVLPLVYIRQIQGAETIVQAPLSLRVRLHAELAEYSIRLCAKSSTQDTVLLVRDSLVCGDVFAVSGQSNAVLGMSLTPPVQSEFLRTYYFGVADSFWGIARANGGADDYNVGGAALHLQAQLCSNLRVPICIINGGLGGSTIEQHFRDNQQPMNYASWYGRFLWRMRQSGLAQSIKGMIWYQGESNMGTGDTEKFTTMYTAWKQDFPAMQTAYVVQIRPSECGQEGQAQLREQQRTLSTRFSASGLPRIVSVAASGLPAHDGCHYGNEAYQLLGNQLTTLVMRDFYKSTDTVGVASPNLLRAYRVNAAPNDILLEFATNDSLVLGRDTLVGGVQRSLVADAFLLNGKPTKATAVYYKSTSDDATAGSSAKTTSKGTQTLVVRFDALPAQVQTIGYIPDKCYTTATAQNAVPNATCTVYEGPWITTRRGVGVLTFADVPVQSVP
jgi:tetratricopeptide (TPR) repeat protein